MTTLILFHWTECGACQEFMPLWDNEISKEFVCLKIEANDTTKSKECKITDDDFAKIIKWKEENVRGYPTLAKWDGHSMTEFTGNRTDKASLKDFVKPVKKGGRRKTKKQKKRKMKTKRVKFWVF